MSAPLTPMEEGGTWATLAEGDTFLQAVASDSGNLTIFDIGQCSDGNQMRVCVVAPGGVGSLSEAAGALMIVASQHGQERPPREAALRLIRDLAYTTDPGLLAALPVVVVPTANPYGTVNVTRGNANGDDINRSHINLSTPEALLIAELAAALSPALVIDGHTAGSPTWEGHPVTGQLNFLSHKRDAAPSIRAWATAAFAALTDHVSPVTTAWYPLAEHEGTMTNAYACRGIPNLLVETLETATDGEQVDRHLMVMEWAVTYVAANAAELAQVKADARAWYAAEGFAAHVPIYLYENGLAEAPLGYTIPADTPPRTLAALGVRAHSRDPRSTDLYVPMDQPHSPLIPWLLDERAPRPIVQGRPVFHTRVSEPVDLLAPDDLHMAVVRDDVRRLVTEHGIVWGA